MKSRTHRPFSLAVLWCVAIASFATAPRLRAQTFPEGAAVSATQVLKWKDGKKACILLGFDDSAPSQLKNVVPELEKRKIVGNFYLVTGNKLYENLRPQWEAAARSPFVVVANHSFTHKGALDPAELETELAKCNEVLYALHPERPQPYLLGFGKPGGVPWVVSKEEVAAALTKHHLVERPPFAGPPINYKSAAETVAVIDAALAKGEMRQLVFHGVGGDWLVTPVEWFTALLEKLEAHREELWIADVVSWHQYVRERDTAEIRVLASETDAIRLALTTKLDPALYDLPLTLATKVPAAWTNCTVSQGAQTRSIVAKDGVLHYPAQPGGGEIAIRPVTAK